MSLSSSKEGRLGEYLDMTCQWCKNYRRRRGFSKCWYPNPDGTYILKDAKGADKCDKFDPRKSCTTCEHRCLPDEKAANIEDSEVCQKWTLRKLTTWGGRRNFAKTKQKEGEDQ